jgi:hypothetical protein
MGRNPQLPVSEIKGGHQPIPLKPSYTQYAHLTTNNNGEDYFTHIYGDLMGTRMCGDHPIFEITLEVDGNQEKNIGDIEYWGWINGNGSLTMVFAAYFLFNMCFPYGVEASEKDGKGIAVKFKIVNSKLIKL